MLCASDSRGFLSQAILKFKFQLIQIMSCSYLELCGSYQTDPGKNNQLFLMKLVLLDW